MRGASILSLRAQHGNLTHGVPHTPRDEPFHREEPAFDPIGGGNPCHCEEQSDAAISRATHNAARTTNPPTTKGTKHTKKNERRETGSPPRRTRRARRNAKAVNRQLPRPLPSESSMLSRDAPKSQAVCEAYDRGRTHAAGLRGSFRIVGASVRLNTLLSACIL
jgi:hypothetical protein